jgi:hypothetical protein
MAQPEIQKTTNHHAPQAYRGNGNHAWERVTDNTTRLRVPGGWLYRTYATTGGYAMAFVPTPAHVI